MAEVRSGLMSAKAALTFALALTSSLPCGASTAKPTFRRPPTHPQPHTNWRAAVATIQDAKRDIMAWPAWHDNYKFLTWRDTHLIELDQQVHVLWGTLGVDRSGTSAFNEEELGQVIYDPEFDAADPAAQLALWQACDEIPRATGLSVFSADDLVACRKTRHPGECAPRCARVTVPEGKYRGTERTIDWLEAREVIWGQSRISVR